MSNYNITSDFNFEQPDNKSLNLKSYVWIGLFVVSVITVAFLTIYELSLLWCALPIMVLSTIIPYNNQSSFSSNFFELPHGIFFLIIGESIVTPQVATSTVKPVIDSFTVSNPNLFWFTSVISSGLSVNISNDLPTSAIIAPLLADMSFVSEAH